MQKPNAPVTLPIPVINRLGLEIYPSIQFAGIYPPGNNAQWVRYIGQEDRDIFREVTLWSHLQVDVFL